MGNENTLKEVLEAMNFQIGKAKGTENKVAVILRYLGMNTSILGYTYIKEAICMIYDNPDYLNNIVNGLYPDVAEKYGATPSRVERAIRHAAFTIMREEISAEHRQIKFLVFGTIGQKKSIKNSEFLGGLVAFLRENDD